MNIDLWQGEVRGLQVADAIGQHMKTLPLPTIPPIMKWLTLVLQ